MDECGIIEAIKDNAPIFRNENFGVSLYYRQDPDTRIDATWHTDQWLWTIHNKDGRLKGYGYAKTGKDAMCLALAAAKAYRDILAEKPTVEKPMAVA